MAKKKRKKQQEHHKEPEPVATVKTEQLTGPVRASRWIWIGLIIIVVAGAWFRLHDLGAAPLRADTIIFHNICSQPISFDGFFTQWMDLMGGSGGQFPFAMAFTKLVMDVFNLPLNEFSLRLPAALWGILTIGIAFGAGRAFGGPRFGLLLALLLALNPYHIQATREAYFYPPLLAGAFLMLWVALDVLNWVTGKTGKPGTTFHILNIAGFFLMTYSQPTGWPTAFLLTAVIVGGLLYKAWSTRKWGILLMVLLEDLILGLPLLFAGWGLPQMRMVTGEAARKVAEKALAVSELSLGGMVYKSLTSYAWGGTWFRAGFTFLVVLLGLAVLWRSRRKLTVWLPVYVIAGGFLLFLISRSRAGAMFGTRYILPLLPAYLVLLAMGVFAFSRDAMLPERIPARVRRWGGVVVLLLAVVLLIYPAWLCTQLEGKATPYKKITGWVDRNLPSGTPVLVDRWFEPWNELRVYNSTNAFYTFTVPNEPVETFLGNRWRQTAQQFFMRFPDAAYLEITKEYWTVDGVGPWDWPRHFFDRHIAFTNEAGLELRKLGLATRNDFYASNTNRLIVELFYNTPENIARKALAAGQELTVMFGPGWKYMKPWQQTRRFEDYRVMEGQAPLMVYNGSNKERQVRLDVQGVALNGTKRVRIPDGEIYDFPPSRMVTRELGPFAVKPGWNRIVLSDQLWPAAQIPLLVAQCSVYPLP
jgi:hypothetical protein